MLRLKKRLMPKQQKKRQQKKKQTLNYVSRLPTLKHAFQPS